MKSRIRISAAILTVAISGSALAAVSAEEAKALGTTLTRMGAEKAGNKEGTIPPYTGGEKIPAPAGWNVKTQGYPDPWNEKPLFSITAQNAAKYADKLDGMIDIFKKYPNFRMDIYPSHRAYTWPQYVEENTVKNATVCKGADDELKLDGCYAGTPFPIPKTGRQAMWNHALFFSAYSLVSNHLATWVTPPSRAPVLQSDNLLIEQSPIYDPAKKGVIKADEVYYAARLDQLAPARAVGVKYVFLYNIDTLGIGARAWAYIPGQRRVKLSPDLKYDTPSPISGGALTMDENQVFIGPLDRFDFKLLGKKEKFIMYDNFKLSDPRVCPDAKVVASKNFPDPDCVRWELHRVWVVEATLKPEFRHVYKKRKFFFDEDGHAGGSAEGYDASGALYRVVNGVNYPFFDGAGYISTSVIGMDLTTGIWTFQGSTATQDGAWKTTPGFGKFTFSPESLAGEGIR